MSRAKLIAKIIVHSVGVGVLVTAALLTMLTFIKILTIGYAFYYEPNLYIAMAEFIASWYGLAYLIRLMPLIKRSI